ncbi:TetR/AcrR family transcriptional regulator [Salinisphaera aquimarina]|uniref:TetR/AcrR family transcriptional regulator n=1 Tax=Salinisphaera aquimarina TaxID=2094031 RepID=A0ABV7EWG4_9GAMM
MASASPAAAYQRQISEEKRDAILDAALDCFLERGFAGTSLNRIANAADVSTATLYRHFPTKDELFAQIVERPFLGTTPDARTDWPAGKPHTVLPDIAAQYARRILTPYFHPLVRALISEALRAPEMGHALEQRGHGPFLAAVRHYFEREHQLGALHVADPGLAAEQFLGMISSVVFWPRMLNDARRPSKAKVQRTCDEAVATCLARYATGQGASSGSDARGGAAR